ncbi:MAG: glycosyltransferase [Candidatus Rokubacteria bacterium]|nr:glycosyltransferase [Candidatus Rokubacteria bacterium]
MTVLNQARLAAREGARGIGVWRLGAEDPAVWSVVRRDGWPSESFDVRQLRELDARRALRSYGNGEILRVAERPRNGARDVWRTDAGDVAERYGRYPSHYVIENSGKSDDARLIALTFDDGPDGQYTPQILDILREHQVPATFFVLGVNAEAHPALLKRLYHEGHEIGNHSYSHPNLAEISPARMKLELNATQRIIQHTLGVSTLLFRPPYAADSEPETPQEIEAIWHAQEFGYLTISERIDPHDWEPGLTAEAIVSEVLAEQHNGRIVLLHDGGGDRSATVEALPNIIAELRARGYRFVTVSELIGKTRAEVMPPDSRREFGLATLAGPLFRLKARLAWIFGLLFVGSIALVLIRALVFGALAIYQKRHARRRRLPPFEPPVSVIVPAQNEASVIVRTVQSVLANGYDTFEVIVVDDGSTDATAAVIQQTFASDPRVRLHRQAKAGKAAALNAALALAEYPIVVAIDADTTLRVGTIGTLVRHFADPEVGAVSGNARVGNRGTWLTRFQAIEYVCAFNLERRALDVLNAITVVPGAVGAWRKDLIQRVGGFTADTLAEDTDVTLAIRRLGFRIRYEEDAVAYTEVPRDTQALLKQRLRWLFGTLQAAWKYKHALFRPSHGSLGFVALPSIWLFQMVLPLVSPIAEIAMIVALVRGNWEIVLVYWTALFGVELLTALLAYTLEEEAPYDLRWLPAQRLYYRLLLLYVAVKSLLYAMKGTRLEWTKLERPAEVDPLWAGGP